MVNLLMEQLCQVPEHLLLASRLELQHPVNCHCQILPACTRPGVCITVNVCVCVCVCVWGGGDVPCISKGDGKHSLVSSLQKLHYCWNGPLISWISFIVLQ